MPIAAMHMGEGPLNPVKRKATDNPWIIVNILTVVIINELVLKRLAKNDQNDCRKNKADNDGSKTLKAEGRRRKEKLRWIANEALPAIRGASRNRSIAFERKTGSSRSCFVPQLEIDAGYLDRYRSDSG